MSGGADGGLQEFRKKRYDIATKTSKGWVEIEMRHLNSEDLAKVLEIKWNRKVQ